MATQDTAHLKALILQAAWHPYSQVMRDRAQPAAKLLFALTREAYSCGSFIKVPA